MPEAPESVAATKPVPATEAVAATEATESVPTAEGTVTAAKRSARARSATEGPAGCRRSDNRNAGNGNEHGRRDRWSRGYRSCGRRTDGLGHRHRGRRLDFWLRWNGNLGWRGRGLGWDDDVLGGAGTQRDCRTDTDRQRNLQRHHRTDEYHRERATYQQDGPAPLRGLIQTSDGGRFRVLVWYRAVRDVGFARLGISGRLWNGAVFGQISG